jgi:(S)-ureidoglycine-glyoxylate aminotransferase
VPPQDDTFGDPDTTTTKITFGLMPVADLSLPSRLLAGGGPSAPDPRVLRALTTPVIGQFDPAFTSIMDDVMRLARRTFLTANARCFPVSGLASAGLEAVLNTLLEVGDTVAVGGGPHFVGETTEIARRCGAHVVHVRDMARGTQLVVAPLIDPTLGTQVAIDNLASACHAQGARLIVEATLALGGCEVRVDDWHIDACVAGVDYAIGAPSGMALVTYTAKIEELMLERKTPPRTSYLDLLQLQAYWSPERLNHHTAPTSLVYSLREALRLVQAEGLAERWARHHQVGQALREGLRALGLNVRGDPPYAIVELPANLDEAEARNGLRERFGVQVRLIAAHTWRLGLLGADATLDSALRVVAAVEQVLSSERDTAVSAALNAFGST